MVDTVSKETHNEPTLMCKKQYKENHKIHQINRILQDEIKTRTYKLI